MACKKQLLLWGRFSVWLQCHQTADNHLWKLHGKESETSTSKETFILFWSFQKGIQYPQQFTHSIITSASVDLACLPLASPSQIRFRFGAMLFGPNQPAQDVFQENTNSPDLTARQSEASHTKS